MKMIFEIALFLSCVLFMVFLVRLGIIILLSSIG